MATETLHLTVRGMTCANCVRSVERKLSFTPGVLGATVDLEGGRATVEYESSQVKPEALAEARLAEKAAVNDHSRGAARQVIGTVSPYAQAPNVSPR